MFIYFIVSVIIGLLVAALVSMEEGCTETKAMGYGLCAMLIWSFVLWVLLLSSIYLLPYYLVQRFKERKHNAIIQG